MKRFEGVTVLIVDDEVDLRRAIGNQLLAEGCKVIVASNIKEAFSIVQTTDIDFIVSDIRMPGGSGLELLKQIRARHPEKPPVCFMSGFSDSYMDDAFDSGALALLPKPFSMRELVTVMETGIRREQAA